MGLLGTVVYLFVQISHIIELLQNFLEYYIGIFGVILTIAMLLRVVVQHRPREFEKRVNLAAWIVGCIVSTVIEMQHPTQLVQTLLYGIGASVLFFLIIIFLEETFWAIKKVRQTARDG